MKSFEETEAVKRELEADIPQSKVIEDLETM